MHNGFETYTHVSLLMYLRFYYLSIELFYSAPKSWRDSWPT